MFSTAHTSSLIDTSLASSTLSRDYDYLLKIVLIGDSGTGKSCILQRYSNNQFDAGYISTIGVDFEVKTIQLGTKLAKLQMWDTAGQERFHNITTSYYRGAHCIMLVYDITSRDSFLSLPRWIRDIKHYANDHVQVMIIGNKLDLSAKRRMVTEDEGMQMAKELGCMWMETSAREDLNIDRAFHQIATRGMAKRIELDANKPQYQQPDTVDLESNGSSFFRCFPCTIL